MGNEREVVVLSGVRTAVGGYGGSLKDKTPTELAAAVVRAAVERAGVAPEDIGHAVFGNVIHTERQDMYLARAAAVNGGLPQGDTGVHPQPSVRQRPAGDRVGGAADQTGRLRGGRGRRGRVYEPRPVLGAGFTFWPTDG